MEDAIIAMKQSFQLNLKNAHSADNCLENCELPEEDQQIECFKLAANERINEEAVWPVAHRTHNDKLTLAFSFLSRQGVVCREFCGNTISEGKEDIQAEMDAATGDVIGFVFYHSQDAQTAQECGTLWLAFGGRNLSDDAAALTVGEKLMISLNTVGLRPEWNRKSNERVTIKAFQWDRRVGALLREALKNFE